MIKLVQDKVAIQAIPDADKSPGGIIIPDIAKERCDQGIIKYIGPKVKHLKVGDYVVFGGYDGTTVSLDGEGTLIIMREVFIRMVLEPPDTAVKGLYFKTKFDYKFVFNLIKETLIHSNGTLDDMVFKIMEVMNDNEPYFEATYEQIFQLAASSFESYAREVKTRNRGIFDREKEYLTLPFEDDENGSTKN